MDKMVKIDNYETVPPTFEKVLGGQGWIGLIDHMGNEKTIVNAARVAFGKKITVLKDKDKKLLKYLLDNKHTSPFEHVTMTFVIHCPLFVRSQWQRHRTWAYNEISRRYTEENLKFYVPQKLRIQSKKDKQLSIKSNKLFSDDIYKIIDNSNKQSLKLYKDLLKEGICREQARGVLSQNLMTTFWGTVNLHNLIHFLYLRDSDHAQYEIQVYAKAIRKLIKSLIPFLGNLI